MAGQHQEFGVRFMKASAESLARKLGTRVGHHGLFQAVGDWLNQEFGEKAAHYIATLGGIGGAAAFQVPDWLSDPFVRFGLDRGVVQSILEEAVDAGLQATASAMEKKRSRPRKKGEPAPGPEDLRMSEEEADLIFARVLQEKLSGSNLSILIESLALRKNIAECVTAFRTDLAMSETEKEALRERYYNMLRNATPEEQRTLRDLGERRVWQIQEIADYVDQSAGDVEAFLKLLQTRQQPIGMPVAKGALAWLKQHKNALLGQPQPGADNDVDRIRDGVVAYTNRLQKSVRDQTSERLRKKRARLQNR